MANPVFPQTLPGPELDSIDYPPVTNNIIRSQMDAGPAKMRRRFTSVAQDFACTLYLTQDQFDALMAFYDVTLASVLPFDWYDWRSTTGALVTYRFKKRPGYRPWGHEHYQVSLDLEIVP